MITVILTKNFFLFFSIIIFFISVWGFTIANKNIILYIICLEILFISCAINFVNAALTFGEILGFIYFMGGLVIAGCETAIGLAFVLRFYKKRFVSSVYKIKNLKAGG